ncbi:hypothetical protein U1Q18_036472 [Sarracenia purpurea var. burkii]
MLGHLGAGFSAYQREVISQASETYVEGEAEPGTAKEGDDSNKNNLTVDTKKDDFEAEATTEGVDEGFEESESSEEDLDLDDDEIAVKEGSGEIIGMEEHGLKPMCFSH